MLNQTLKFSKSFFNKNDSLKFQIPEKKLRDHISASEYFIRRFQKEQEISLYELVKLFNDYGKCVNLGIDCISSIKFSCSESFPVICIDVNAGKVGWSGANMCFFAQHLKSRQGFLVVRNQDSFIPGKETITRKDFFEITKQHEVIHILQCLSKRNEDLFLKKDLDLANGKSSLIPCIVAMGELPYGDAKELAKRFFLQHLKNEIEAYNTVDYTCYLDLFKGLPDKLGRLRKEILFSMLPLLLWSTGCAFLDTYCIPWEDFVLSLKKPMDELISHSFMENTFCIDNKEMSTYLFLQSIELNKGIIKNRGLPENEFRSFTGFIRQVDSSTAIYNEKTIEAKNLISPDLT